MNRMITPHRVEVLEINDRLSSVEINWHRDAALIARLRGEAEPKKEGFGTNGEALFLHGLVEVEGVITHLTDYTQSGEAGFFSKRRAQNLATTLQDAIQI